MLLILLPVIVAVVAYLAWKNRSVRGCRWRADTRRNQGSLRMYHCVSCGAEAYTASKGPPVDCKKGIGGKGL